VKGNVSSEYGQIKIHKKAIIQIAEKAAYEVKGVKAAGLACHKGWGKFLNLFGFEGMKVILGSETKNEIKIIIPIIVSWGENLVDVAYEVQKKIIFYMMSSLGINSLSIDVKIKGVEK
jgi:uncharacterized alkaline shock family protein YloU